MIVSRYNSLILHVGHVFNSRTLCMPYCMVKTGKVATPDLEEPLNKQHHAKYKACSIHALVLKNI